MMGFSASMKFTTVVSVSLVLVALSLTGCPSIGGAVTAGENESELPATGDNTLVNDQPDSNGNIEQPTTCQDQSDCDDGNLCTTGKCVDGICEYTSSISSCDDGDTCTENDACAEGVCAGTAVECSAGQVCQNGQCVDADNSTPTPTGETLVLDLDQGITMTLMRIPAGMFVMGTSSQDFAWLDHSRPVHTVTISRDYYIGIYEVTQAQWQAVMGNVPSYTGDDRPVVNVSWDDAAVFIDTLATMSGYDIRLPSEAEWEYACRAGTTTEYNFGDAVADLDSYAWYQDNSSFTTHDVGTLLPNAWGLYDMHGNVWEWCEDLWHDDYTGAPDDGSPWMVDGGSINRVLRSGSWKNPGVSLLRSAARKGINPTDLDGGHGFRIAAGM